MDGKVEEDKKKSSPWVQGMEDNDDTDIHIQGVLSVLRQDLDNLGFECFTSCLNLPRKMGSWYRVTHHVVQNLLLTLM